MRRCSECGTEKPLTGFYIRKRGPQAGKPHGARCKDCTKRRKNAYNAACTPEHRSAIAKRCYYKRHAKRLETMRQYSAGVRLEALAHYSQGSMACACCGERELAFLTFDHVQRDGAAHRKQMGAKTRGFGNTAWWLKKHQYPQGIQVLCYNCNCGRERNGGVCPHQKAKEEAS